MRYRSYLALLASVLAISCDRAANSSIADEQGVLAPRIFDAAGGVLPQVDSVRIVVRNANAPEASPFYAKSIDWHRHGDTIVGIPKNASLAVVVEGVKLQPDGSVAIWWAGSAASTFSGTRTLDAQMLPVPVVVGDTAAPRLEARIGDTAESTDSTIRLVWRFSDQTQVVAVVNGDTIRAIGDSVVWIRSWESGKSIFVVASFRDRDGNLSRDSLDLVRRDAVAPPRFSVEPGGHDDIVRLECSDSTPDARIEYSLDSGSNWTVCDGTIVLGSDTTILARATKPGWSASPVVSARYRIRAAVPTFSVASGTSSNDLLVVKLSSATAGARFEISMDSAKTWTAYQDSIVLGSFLRLYARTTKDGLATSDTVSASYSVRAAVPTFSVASGASSVDLLVVKLSSATTGARFEISMDSAKTWTAYHDSIVLGSSLRLYARTTKDGLATSDTVSASYSVRAAVPTFSVASGTSSNDLLVVKVSSATTGAQFEISIDSTKTWTAYHDSIVLGRSLKLYARAIKDGLATSDTVSASYSVQAAVPTFSVASGTSSNDLLAVKLSSATTGARFEISMDSAKTWTAYQDSIVLGSSLRLYARAIKDGLATSATASATYAVRAATPTVDRQGVFNRYPTIHLQSATPAAEIRYTLDGTTPTSTSALYTDSLVIDTTCELRAIAFKSGLAASGVLSASFQLAVDGNVLSSLTESLLWYARKTKLSASTSIEIDFHCITGSATPTSASPLCNDSFLVHSGDTIQVAAYSKSAPKIQPKTATFVFQSTWNESVDYDTLVDVRDNQIYRTVAIGGKTWMAQNLNFARDSSWCYADAADSCLKYGRLYSWPAAMNLSSMNEDTLVDVGDAMRQGVCPTGWHLPSRLEWIALWSATGTTGSTSVHIRANWGWSSEVVDDMYGFRLLAAGQRARDQTLLTPEYQLSGTYANLWTATEERSYAAFGMSILLSSNAIQEYYKYFGLGVRCVKD